MCRRSQESIPHPDLNLEAQFKNLLQYNTTDLEETRSLDTD